MIGRPTPIVVREHFVALALAGGCAIWLTPEVTWDWGLFALLLAFGVASDLRAIPVRGNVKLSASFLAIVTAVVFLGASVGAMIGVLTILAGWVRTRYAGHLLLNNIVTYAWFPLIAGALFHAAENNLGVTASEPAFYLLVFGLFVIALAIDFSSIAGYACYLEGSRFSAKVRRALVPLLPSEFASALLAVGVAFAYVNSGLGAIALFALVFAIFQYLLEALLVSQERAEELELRAKQLAGFQIALLGALLRTLDLRDRMTARHSAAVARYAREIAAEAGLPKEDQELAHTAGLLHDIGKFVLPDEILKSRRPLTPEEWNQMRRHPYEGARIVSEIDGYAPVGDIILAHHERIDGLGYPRGLKGDEIPEIARILAVADAYDVMTSRDSYKETMSSFEAIAELREAVDEQFDSRFVDVFIRVLATKDITSANSDDADFETELMLDQRISNYVDAVSGRTAPEPGSAGAQSAA